jgi:cystathionine beta-synthase
VTAARLIAGKDRGAPSVVHVAPEATVRQALNLISTFNVSQVPVLEHGHSVGAVSEQALMAHALENPGALDQPVRELMDAPFPVVDADCPVDRLTSLLSQESAAVLVRRNGELAGIVTRYDVLHQMAGIR